MPFSPFIEQTHSLYYPEEKKMCVCHLYCMRLAEQFTFWISLGQLHQFVHMVGHRVRVLFHLLNHIGEASLNFCEPIN